VLVSAAPGVYASVRNDMAPILDEEREQIVAKEDSSARGSGAGNAGNSTTSDSQEPKTSSSPSLKTETIKGHGRDPHRYRAIRAKIEALKPRGCNKEPSACNESFNFSTEGDKEDEFGKAVDIFWADYDNGDAKAAKSTNQEEVEDVVHNRKDESVFWGRDLPTQIKCTTADVRIVHFCVEPRFFDPAARVYFDTGSDGAGEVDLFTNGSISPTIDLIGLYLPWRLGHSKHLDRWTVGPNIGVGIGQSSGTETISAAVPGDDVDAQEVQETSTSSAPVVLLSLGGLLEYKPNGDQGISFGLEAGFSIGFSADELFDDNDDSAVFVGLKLDIPTGNRQ